jgi:hypothetical protein
MDNLCIRNTTTPGLGRLFEDVWWECQERAHKTPLHDRGTRKMTSFFHHSDNDSTRLLKTLKTIYYYSFRHDDLLHYGRR